MDGGRKDVKQIKTNRHHQKPRRMQQSTRSSNASAKVLRPSGLRPLLAVALVVLMVPAATVKASIGCYECDSSNNFSCTEYWDPSLPVTSQYYSNCSHVFEANYCIKMTGVFDGKLGTKRFCSSRDWGYYCEYIKRPGDIQEYRSCVFSCSISGCNSANSLLLSSRTTTTTQLCSLVAVIVVVVLFGGGGALSAANTSI